jgi:hypothetical protein
MSAHTWPRSKKAALSSQTEALRVQIAAQRLLTQQAQGQQQLAMLAQRQQSLQQQHQIQGYAPAALPAPAPAPALNGLMARVNEEDDSHGNEEYGLEAGNGAPIVDKRPPWKPTQDESDKDGDSPAEPAKEQEEQPPPDGWPQDKMTREEFAQVSGTPAFTDPQAAAEEKRAKEMADNKARCYDGDPADYVHTDEVTGEVKHEDGPPQASPAVFLLPPADFDADPLGDESDLNSALERTWL